MVSKVQEGKVEQSNKGNSKHPSTLEATYLCLIYDYHISAMTSSPPRRIEYELAHWRGSVLCLPTCVGLCALELSGAEALGLDFLACGFRCFRDSERARERERCVTH